MFYETMDYAIQGRYEFDLGDTPLAGCGFEKVVKVWKACEPQLITEHEGYKVFELTFRDGFMTVAMGAWKLKPLGKNTKYADKLYVVPTDESLWGSEDTHDIYKMVCMQDGSVRVRVLQKADRILMGLPLQ